MSFFLFLRFLLLLFSRLYFLFIFLGLKIPLMASREYCGVLHSVCDVHHSFLSYADPSLPPSPFLVPRFSPTLATRLACPLLNGRPIRQIETGLGSLCLLPTVFVTTRTGDKKRQKKKREKKEKKTKPNILSPVFDMLGIHTHTQRPVSNGCPQRSRGKLKKGQ